MVSGSFSLPSRGSFHLSFTVLYAIGHWLVFSLGGWSPPASHKVSRVSWYSGYCWIQYIFPYTALTLFGPLFQNGSGNISYSYCSPLPRSARTTVWALTISLAATFAITVVFFSSGYLDVSVHRVPPLYVMYWRTDTWSSSKWVSPFRHLRIIEYVLLPAAFRSLSRLSSAVSA